MALRRNRNGDRAERAERGAYRDFWSWQNPSFIIVSGLLLILVAVLLVLALGLDQLVAVMVVLLVLDGLIAGAVGYQFAVHSVSEEWETEVIAAREEAKAGSDKYWEAKLSNLRSELSSQVEAEWSPRIAEARVHARAETEAQWEGRMAAAIADARAEAEREIDMRLAMEVEKAKLEAYREMEDRLLRTVETAMARTEPAEEQSPKPLSALSDARPLRTSPEKMAAAAEAMSNIADFVPEPPKKPSPAKAPPAKPTAPAPRVTDSYIDHLRKAYLEKRG